MTIIVPFLNNSIDLAVLLTQLQQQTVKPKCVYIADNSPDGEGLRIATRYRFDDSVPFAVQPKVGPIHKSWNTGIEFANGDDVAILNDDITIPTDFIETLEYYVRSGLGTMYCPGNAGFPPTQRVRKGYVWNPKEIMHTYRLLNHQEYVLPPSITGWCMVLPNETIKTIGVFDEDFQLYFGDKDYEARIFNAGGKVCFIDMFVNHFGSSSTHRVKKEEIDYKYQHEESIFKKKYNLK